MRNIHRFLFVLVALVCNHAGAASFDCKNARSDIEIMVCMDYRLSGLDDQLAYVYAKASPSNEAKEAQRDWVKQRNQCKDFKCLVDAYAKRIKAIDPQAMPVFAYPPSDNGKWEYFAENEEGFWARFQLNKQGDLLIGYPIHSHQGLNLRTGKNETSEHEFVDERSSYTLIDLSFNREEDSVTHEITNRPKLSLAKNIEDGEQYSRCQSSINDVGLRFERPNEPWRNKRPHRVLFIEKLTEKMDGRNWPIQACSHEDFNTQISFMPHFHAFDFIWNDNFYVLNGDGSQFPSYLLRLDRAMNTYGDTIGHLVFVPEGDDLSKLVERQCGTPKTGKPKLACVDRRLSKLTSIVEKFYK